MSRKPSRHSRTPKVTENEIALKWEIKRLRAELAATIKKMEANEPAGSIYIRGQKRALFYLKIERIHLRTAQAVIPPEQRCGHCGGASWFQMEHAYFEALRELPDPDGDLDPSEWRVPDELPHPDYDFARNVVPAGYEPPALNGYQRCGGKGAPRDWTMPEGWQADAPQRASVGRSPMV